MDCQYFVLVHKFKKKSDFFSGLYVYLDFYSNWTECGSEFDYCFWSSHRSSSVLITVLWSKDGTSFTINLIGDRKMERKERESKFYNYYFLIRSSIREKVYRSIFFNYFNFLEIILYSFSNSSAIERNKMY